MSDASLAAAILGAGLCCPLGSDLSSAGAAYRGGERNFRKASNGPFGPDGHPITLSAALSYDEVRDYEERLQRLFETALRDLESRAPMAELGPLPLRLVVPSSLRGNPIAGRLAAWTMEAFPNRIAATRLVADEIALSLREVASVAERVTRGEAPAMLVGALDSHMSAEALDRLALEDRLLTRTNPHGIVPGEGAVLFLVAAPDAASSHSPIGAFRAVHDGRETEDVNAPGGILGRGLAEPFRVALRGRVPDRLLVDLNGERWRSEELGFVLSGTSGISDALLADFEAPLGTLGDCGAASSAILAALALVAGLGEAQTPPGGRELSLLTAADRRGLRCAALLERFAAMGTA